MIESLHVHGFGVLVPYPSLMDFPLGPSVELPKPDLSLLDRTLRRGLSDVTRLFMHAARLALEDAQTAPETVHVVFGSAFGELATAEALMQQAFDENASSPARFRNSVHNSAPGLFSISTHNVHPATAIAAGWNTVAMALLEAHTQLVCGAERVLLVFADERVPLALSAEHAHGVLGAAFVLSLDARSPVRGTLRNLRRTEHAPDGQQPFAGQNHPLGPAISLARALEERASRTLLVGGDAGPWCIDVDARVNP